MKRYDFLLAGAGPCGLGAAWTLQSEFPGHSFLLIDSDIKAGGFASSEATPEGFVFDHGGHVLFPHPEFREFSEMLEAVRCEWVESCPVRGVYFGGQLIPAPVQKNLHRLPRSEWTLILADILCLRLREYLLLRSAQACPMHHETLEEYLLARFGKQLSRRIMGPMNRKMWSHCPSKMSSAWVRERSGSALPNIPQVRFRRALRQRFSGIDDLGWLPTTRVRYPATGGTGCIWNKAAARIEPGRLALGKQIRSIDSAQRIAILSDGSRIPYAKLVSSMPLDLLLKSIGDPKCEALAASLRRSSALLFGFGIAGELPNHFLDVHTFQCPEPDLPFWRVTIPSNVSSGNVPDVKRFYSVLCEVSRPASDSPEVPDGTRKEVLEALKKIGIIAERCRVVSVFEKSLPYGYPLPFLGRDQLLSSIHRKLLPMGIFSRGRFGGWRYEVSNQDHAFMQGVEVVRSLITGAPESVYRNAF